MTNQAQNKTIAAAVKEKNIPFYLDGEAVRSLIARVAGKQYSSVFEFQKLEPLKTGMDRYRISGQNGKIRIEATSGVAAAVAFRYYVEHCCGSYFGPLTERKSFPAIPPTDVYHEEESVCLYRYFLNFCTFGYTLAFWNRERWQRLLDWMMMAGYNLVLNPLGNESVWQEVLRELGYTEKEIGDYISGPVFFPWQCMMNLTGWGDEAPAEFYKERLALPIWINDYLRSFGAAPMLPGFSGMVPADFKAHFPDSSPLDQGLWCSMPRPAILLPGTDGYFDRVAKCFYQKEKELFGDGFRYFSTDPFHEGGNREGVKLNEYADHSIDAMRLFGDEPVWFLQGWQSNPIREMLRALNPANVLIGNLRSTDRFDGGDNFADYPWLYCCVNNFGGQRVMRGNMNKMLSETFRVITDENYSCVGLGIIPEGIECDEILFDIYADLAVRRQPIESDSWLKDYLTVRYGVCPDNTFKAWKIIRDKVYVGDTELIPRESSLLTRPSLTVNMVSSYSSAEFSYPPQELCRALELLAEDMHDIPISEPYRLDLADIARQVVANDGWTYLKGIQDSFSAGDIEAFEQNAAQFTAHYDLQEEILKCDSHFSFGAWLEMAKQHGKTPAQRAYYEYLARTLITLWGDRDGASELRDYAAREWNGLLEDFYRPRWESYINILRRSLLTGKPPMDFERYDAEYFFATLSKKYPITLSGDLKKAVMATVSAICKKDGKI